MNENPFKFGTVVDGPYFTDREDEIGTDQFIYKRRESSYTYQSEKIWENKSYKESNKRVGPPMYLSGYAVSNLSGRSCITASEKSVPCISHAKTERIYKIIQDNPFGYHQSGNRRG